MSTESPVHTDSTTSGEGLRRKRRRPYHLYEPIPSHHYVLIAILSFAALFLLWSAASYGHWVDNLFLPTPTQVWDSAVYYATDGDMWEDIKVSVTRILLGFVLSTVVAIPIGVLMGVNKRVEAAAEPPIDFIRYMPAVAFIPLTLIWFGTTETQKIVILFIGVFFQEVLLIMDNVKNVPRPYVDMAYTLGLSQWKTIWKVVVPASLPGIVDTLRICMGWAWTYLVVVELVGANSGLGFRIQSAQRYLDTPQILIGIVIIGILGLGFDFAFKALYRWAFPYLSRKGR
jgi:NitT/TauT family transport system permease protein